MFNEMCKKFSMKKVAQRGFTLTELVVTLIIIAIVAGALITYFGQMPDKAKKTGVNSDFRVIRLGIEEALNRTNGQYEGGSINTYLISENLDKTYAISDEDGTTGLKTDPYGNFYRIEFYQATDTTVGGVISADGLPAAGGTSSGDAMVIIRSAGKDGSYGTNTAGGAGDDLLTAIYYRDGLIDTCNLGFGENDAQFLDTVKYADNVNAAYCGASVL